MCSGLAFFKDMTDIRVFFPNPRARLICRTKSGESIEAAWGRRNEAEHPETRFPVTGWARLESIKDRKWDQFEGEKVHIPALAYMEKDKERESHWFNLEDDEFLVALLLHWKNLYFSYVVTVPTPEQYRHIHHRWVMIEKLRDVEKRDIGKI